MADTLRPATPADLVDAVAEARTAGRRLAIRGGDSNAGFGAGSDATPLDMRGFAGVTDYDPAELVLTTGAATPLAEIAALLAGEGQMLAFDPPDPAPWYGRRAGAATIGGALASASAGSQRLALGAPRDHLLGFKGVSGRGELLSAGGRVVKNVTGYDLPKLACGSRGRLFALTEVTVRVVPAPRERRTLSLEGLQFAAAVAAMAVALGTPAEVAAAAYLPARNGAPSRTILRLQGFGPSVAARATLLERALESYGAPATVAGEEAEAVWTDLRTLAPLPGDLPLWRLALQPTRAPAAIAALEGAWLADWAGGRIWLASAQPAADIRAAAAVAGGHATLLRGPAGLRAAVPALHPPAPGIAALEARVRAAFDPDGVFACGRFGEEARA